MCSPALSQLRVFSVPRKGRFQISLMDTRHYGARSATTHPEWVGERVWFNVPLDTQRVISEQAIDCTVPTTKQQQRGNTQNTNPNTNKLALIKPINTLKNVNLKTVHLWELLISTCTWLWTLYYAQNSSDNLPSYPPNNHIAHMLSNGMEGKL